jgi:hypothetical protein
MFKVLNELKMKKGVGVKGSCTDQLAAVAARIRNAEPGDAANGWPS